MRASETRIATALQLLDDTDSCCACAAKIVIVRTSFALLSNFKETPLASLGQCCFPVDCGATCLSRLRVLAVVRLV